MFESIIQHESLFEVDFVRELRLRQWARQNFVSPELRKASWHPIVLDEMKCRDREMNHAEEISSN